MTTTLLGAATALVDGGYPVFPLRGKLPRTAHGLNDASRDFEQLSDWWDKWPDAGIGIATGRPSSVWVLDIDGDEGAESLRRLEGAHGALPGTVEAMTRNGRHLYFRMPAGMDIRNSAGKVAPGIDVRGTVGLRSRTPEPTPRRWGVRMEGIGTPRGRARS